MSWILLLLMAFWTLPFICYVNRFVITYSVCFVLGKRLFHIEALIIIDANLRLHRRSKLNLQEAQTMRFHTSRCFARPPT